MSVYFSHYLKQKVAYFASFQRQIQNAGRVGYYRFMYWLRFNFGQDSPPSFQVLYCRMPYLTKTSLTVHCFLSSFQVTLLDRSDSYFCQSNLSSLSLFYIQYPSISFQYLSSNFQQVSSYYSYSLIASITSSKLINLRFSREWIFLHCYGVLVFFMKLERCLKRWMERLSLFQSGSAIQQLKKTMSLIFSLTVQFLCQKMLSLTISLRSLSFLSQLWMRSACQSSQAQLLGAPGALRSDFFIQQADMMINLQWLVYPRLLMYVLMPNLHYNNFTTRMDLKSYNKALYQSAKKAFDFAFIQDTDPADEEIFFCNDTDTVKYRLIAKKNQLNLYFYFIDLQNVWRYIENYFRATYYQNFAVKVKQYQGEPALQIGLDNEGFTTLYQTFVTPKEISVMSDRRKFDPLIDVLSKRLASIKRHFLASPFQIMIEAARLNASDKGNRQVPRFSFYLKADRKQKVWLAFEKNQLTVYFGLHFDDKFEQQLGKIFFSQLIDAKKHVQNSPAVAVNDREIPKLLIESFPEEKTQKYEFANGIVSFTIFGNLVRNHRAMASYLAGFRNYAYYHIQSWKCYLHSRVLRRIGIILRDLSHAQIEPFARN